MADVTVNPAGVAATTSAGSPTITTSVSVTLASHGAAVAAGRLKVLPRPLYAGSPALLIPPPPNR
jgi:hypothetical protein